MSWTPHPDVGFESKADWQGIGSAPQVDGVDVLGWNPEWPCPRCVQWGGETWEFSDDETAATPTHWLPYPPLPMA